MRTAVNTITLHQWEWSPFCTKIRLLLDYKGIAYSTRNYNGLLALRVRRLNPAAKVPVLEVKGRMEVNRTLIPDSRDIARYLDHHFPEKPVFPTAPFQRGQAELLANWADESLYFYNMYLRAEYEDAFKQILDSMTAGRPAYEKVLFAVVLKRTFRSTLHHHGTSREPKQKVETRFLELMQALDHTLAEQPWLAGNAISIADFAVAAQLIEILRTSHLGAEILAMPKLGTWIKRFPQQSVGAGHSAQITTQVSSQVQTSRTDHATAD